MSTLPRDDVLEENFRHWLPRLSTFSVVVLLHSVAETQLNTCARRLKRDRALTLDLKELYGSGVLRAKTYVVKVANIDVGNDLGWHELSNLQDIRNIIVHRRGRVGDSLEQRELVQRLMKNTRKTSPWGLFGRMGS